ncbi:Protein of unknown function [Pyronema omphalodes CBS 100304]|uniref:Uncharacterized protein n=1 Tax=Pyronema omphalodes (strain CBS 100304) TaxID=1076935 RepID=U4L888_PYROM|nr:Protein of unknown function [Pyronema omphalodes CBS 100304]
MHAGSYPVASLAYRPATCYLLPCYPRYRSVAPSLLIPEAQLSQARMYANHREKLYSSEKQHDR